MQDQNLKIFLSAIAATQRLQILRSLLQGEMSVGQLAEMMKMSSQAMSHHLSKLKAANLLSARKDGLTIYYSCQLSKVSALLVAIDHFVGEP